MTGLMLKQASRPSEWNRFGRGDISMGLGNTPIPLNNNQLKLVGQS